MSKTGKWCKRGVPHTGNSEIWVTEKITKKLEKGLQILVSIVLETKKFKLQQESAQLPKSLMAVASECF